MNEISVTKKIYNQELTLSTGLLAKQANGAVLATMGKTQVLATAVMSKEASDKSFFPLSVDYIEKFYAAGRIPGSFARREGKPTDYEVHISRLIDRPLRPLFAEGFRNEIQVVLTVLSIDEEHPADVLGMIAASAALTISDIPLKKPIGGVRVGMIEDEIVINPSYEKSGESTLELLVAGTDVAITMIEGGANEISEAKVLEAVTKAHEEIKIIISMQEELRTKVGKAKTTVELFQYDGDLESILRSSYFEKIKTALTVTDKGEREREVLAIYQEAKKAHAESEFVGQVSMILHDFESEVVRNKILDEQVRIDGRKMDEIRPIDCQVNILASAHGSALFTRGQTQSLGVATIGSKKDQQKIDQAREISNKSFLLHYNFPPYSVGEVGRLTGTGRREIGHGMLAERSIVPILPATEDFDFILRLVSEILESNGSSSMATICSGSMALMNAGVPIKQHVAGIAMGLIMDGSKYQVLTDIQGIEDSLGDMDFKVAGTRNGITGFQLDIKIEGITVEIMTKALDQARQARLDILGKMEACISTPSPLKENTPKLEIVKIQIEKIRTLIGAGGKNIKAIVEETGSDIEINDNGEVKIFATSNEVLEKTKTLIESYIGSPKVGGSYRGKIKKITTFGAFIEILPGVDGLCHISKFSNRRVEDLNTLIKEGDELEVMVKEVNEQGKISLELKEKFQS